MGSSLPLANDPTLAQHADDLAQGIIAHGSVQPVVREHLQLLSEEPLWPGFRLRLGRALAVHASRTMRQQQAFHGALKGLIAGAVHLPMPEFLHTLEDTIDRMSNAVRDGQLKDTLFIQLIGALTLHPDATPQHLMAWLDWVEATRATTAQGEDFS